MENIQQLFCPFPAIYTQTGNPAKPAVVQVPKHIFLHKYFREHIKTVTTKTQFKGHIHVIENVSYRTHTKLRVHHTKASHREKGGKHPPKIHFGRDAFAW